MKVLFYMVLYFGFGAVTNVANIAPLVDRYITEEHPDDSEKMKKYFSWMCSILWIAFWPLFIIWGLVSELISMLKDTE